MTKKENSMQVGAITPYYTNNNYRNTNVTRPAFKGALNEQQMTRVLKMLGEKNTDVFLNFDLKNLKTVIDGLINKYSSLGVRSAGIQVVNNKDLPALLGKSVDANTLKDKLGLCIAVGDKYGPIENWGRVYEAKTILATEKDLKSVMN